MAASAFDKFAIRQTETRHCDIHGDYESGMFFFGGRECWAPCAQCHEDNRKRDEEESQKRFAAEQEQARINRAMKIATIPARFAGATFENYHCKNESQRKIYSSAKDYADNFETNRKSGTSVIMTGGVGTGKTHLAVATAHSVIYDHKMTAKYTAIDRVLIAIKSSFNKGSEHSQEEIYECLRKPDLLILDEVGAQHATEFEKLVMFDIVNARYEDMKPTILISNLDIKGVKACVGDRVIDRLRENGGKSFVFDWNSHRR